MSRLIDADDFVHDLAEWYVKESPRMSGYGNQAVADMIWEFIKAVNKRPTIDAAPVVHGHWYVYETGYEDTEAKCSICGFETLVNEPGNGLHMVGDLKYCPHCGAKMDEVTE